ncbi:hypothetical protein LWI29_023783 [Acer saccharum]|uniref:Meiotic nuclear division protein 1 homolog n=1 Tax=Acer saccharum TaxID=4024 RepID=A0AA39REA9_ACESA|nr:hypothetical protein LWI29_023783 [Acer saccharum]
MNVFYRQGVNPEATNLNPMYCFNQVPFPAAPMEVTDYNTGNTTAVHNNTTLLIIVQSHRLEKLLQVWKAIMYCLPMKIMLKKKKKKQSKKRGLSLEEKREKMLQIFYDSQSFYLLKELEKLGPKKGVISQSVKDVVQSLVDDDLVLKDKIGTSVYFWSLPSCAGNQLRNVSRKLDSDLRSSKKRHTELVDQCNALKMGREESDEREEALEELKAIELKYNELKDEIGQYADNDPAAFEAMRNAIEVAHAAANRWTDNIFTLRQWCSNNFPHAKEQLEHVYFEAGITDDFDYLESSPVPLSAVVDQIPETSP